MWNNFPYLRPWIRKTLISHRNYSPRTSGETYYDILKLPRNCTNKDIKDAFIKLSKEHHPDRNKSKESQEKFVKISTAYSVLSKPDARRNYDLGLPRFHHYSQTGFNYHEVPISRNPWDDPFLYANRDKSQDAFYKHQPYYGIEGIPKVPNKVIALLCMVIAGIGVFMQIMAVRRNDILRKSNEAAIELQRIRNKADVNGNELQAQLLEQRFKEEGIMEKEK